MRVQMIKAGSQMTEANIDFLNKYCWNKWVVMWEKIKLDSHLMSYIRNSKWTRNIDVKNETT
jgi:hypothetical protein